MGLRLRRITALEALLWCVLILAPLALVARVPPRREVVDEWLEVQRRGDRAEMMRLLADDPVVDLHVGGRHTGDRGARIALEWRIQTGSVFAVKELVESDDADGREALRVVEQSRVYDLLGATPRYQMWYYVGGGKILREFALRDDPRSEAAVADSLKAFAEWLDPSVRERLFVEGRPRWTGETAGPWLDRLAAWRAAR